MSNIRMQIKDSIMHYLCDDWNNHKRGKAHKENQALFDRKDGYAKWSIIDLEMVMEKVVKGIYAVDLAEHDKQIMYEVTDKMVSNLIRNSRTEIIDDKIQLIVTEDRIKLIAEQMKGEQNND